MSNETQFLIDSLVEHLTLRVMEEYGLSITEALSLVYNSQLYKKNYSITLSVKEKLEVSYSLMIRIFVPK